MLPFVDAFTSIFAGCVVFSTLGYTAAASNVKIDTVVKQGYLYYKMLKQFQQFIVKSCCGKPNR